MTTRRQRSSRWRAKLGFALLICMFCLGLFPASDLTPQGRYELRLAALTGHESFSLSLWTVGAVASKLDQMIGAKPWSGMTDAERIQVLEDYFASGRTAGELEEQIRELANKGVPSMDPQLAELESRLREVRARRAAQSDLVERVIEDQVQTVLREEGISLVQWRSLFFPPVFFKLVDLPHMLVVAYRDRFQMRSQVFMRRTISVAATDAIESAVDGELNVRSLLFAIGGLGTYPTMVGSIWGREWAIGAVSHEWCHVYLTFRPLGLNYGKSGELTAMNETVCSIFGNDVGALVLEKYYGAEKQPRPWEKEPEMPTEPPRREEPQGFNVNRELRKIYLAAEERLKAKDIEGAERIMEEGRRYLAENGVYLRKLNQAFFAFLGSYAEGPDSIRPDPIGSDLRELRRRSPTLRDFMLTVSGMTSYDDLKRVLGKQE